MSYAQAGRFFQAILGSNSVLVTNAPTTIYPYGSNTPAALFTDQTASAAAANPTTTDANGNLLFYSAPGYYIAVVDEAGTNVSFEIEVLPSNQDGGVPSGVTFPFAGVTPPPGYLFANGAAVSRTGYASLFGAIGTTWGAGDGSTTFNLPNLFDKVPVGAGNLFTVGQYGGEQNHTLVEGELASHSHSGGTGTESVLHDHPDSGHGHSASSSIEQEQHTHAFPATNIVTQVSSSVLYINNSGTNPVTGITGLTTGTEEGNHTHGISIGTGNANIGAQNVLHTHAIPSDGSNDPHNNMQPYAVLYHIIKV